MTEKMFSDEFIAAARKVFGDASPRTILTAMRNGDPRINHVQALAARDPTRWFCSAIDENNIARLFAMGDSEDEARKQAELGVTRYREEKQSFRQMAPRADWTFVIYPPDR